MVYILAFRAKITIYLSYFNDFCSMGWTQIIPETIIKISRRSEKYNKESLKESIIIADYLPSEGRESRTDWPVVLSTLNFEPRKDSGS